MIQGIRRQVDCYPLAAADADFLRSQRDKDVARGHWSSGFTQLLPGMVVVPPFVIDRGKKRVIHDMRQAGLNDDVLAKDKHVRLDNLVDFGNILLWARRRYGDRATIFKSDIAEAYRQLPAAIEWQLCQVVPVDGEFHVDRRAQLGAAAWPRIFCAFNSLILWIAINRFGLDPVCGYLDDNFGVSSGSMSIYKGVERPREQNLLLQLWDLVGIPWKPEKQIYGHQIVVIGFEVDIDRLSISLPTEAIGRLVSSIDDFLAFGRAGAPLHRWQSLAGYICWALNVSPWSRPALSEMFLKMRGKSRKYDPVMINVDVAAQLSWLRSRLLARPALRLLEPESRPWTVDEGDIVLFCDASWIGMGFWHDGRGYTTQFGSARPGPDGDSYIVVREALCVVCAIAYAVQSRHRRYKRIGVYTDSLNTVWAFNSLAPSGGLGYLLRVAADLIESSGSDVRVAHVAGKANWVADALSRNQIAFLRERRPALVVSNFEPTHDVLQHLVARQWLDRRAALPRGSALES